VFDVLAWAPGEVPALEQAVKPSLRKNYFHTGEIIIPHDLDRPAEGFFVDLREPRQFPSRCNQY